MSISHTSKNSSSFTIKIIIFFCIFFFNLSGRYAMQAVKQMEPQVKQALQSFPKTVRTCFVISLKIIKLHDQREHYSVMFVCRLLEGATTEEDLTQR